MPRRQQPSHRTDSVEPLDVRALAERVADRAMTASLAMRADPAAGAAVRVGVDAAVPADGELVGDAVAEALAAQGAGVLRVRARDFLRPRSVRLAAGPADPGTGYEAWTDHLGLRREVLDPLGPGGAGTWLATLWDEAADRATRAPRRTAAPGSVLVLDGPYLLRWETADALDLSVHLLVSDAAVRRRLPAVDAERQTGAWARYVEETDPAPRADLVVRAEDPRRPALLTGDVPSAWA
ncbi:hypothetical protein [uncultured Pseudokineococcus sp.]|uniref:hypothetical protein n=1 Tax=uncultured Pseudokineococcus sp. TaxID=1642928 RepID=UPI00260DDBBC|nr:hypothetical protein [uncultured Pseudokineococcus sp.]